MELAYKLWPMQKSEPADLKAAQVANRLLFLHGMGGTGSLWRPVAAALESEFAILAPDQRGHGASQTVKSATNRAPTFTPLDYGRDLVDTLSALHYHPCWVVGHSMGVRSACALAHLKPDWVQGLILIDLGFSGPAGGGLGDGLAQFIKILPARFESRPDAREFMTAKCPDPSIAQYLMAVSVQNADGVTFPFDHGALIQTIEAVRDISIRHWILEVGQRGKPVLVLRGANSLVWSREEFEEEKRLLAGCPAVVFEEFPDAGHGLPFEKRAEFVARVRQFVSTPA